MIQSKTISENSTKTLLARLISDLLNPLTLPVLVFGIAGTTLETSSLEILKLVGITFLLFVIIPVTTAVLLKRYEGIKSLDFHKRSIRTKLYLISIISVGAGGFVFFKGVYTGVYDIFLTTYMTILTLAFLLNFKWKVSVHVGSVVTAIVMLIWIGSAAPGATWPGTVAVILMILIPFLVWSRIQLKVHTWFEILIGGIAGIAPALIILNLMTKLTGQ